MTDGDDFITISHLSNGEALPAVMVANEEFSAIYHAYVSTDNEIFVIRGCAVEQEGLKDIMQAISTIRILKLNTKQAIAPAKPASEFEVESYSATLYSKSKRLNVRASWSVDSARLGYLKKGQSVNVTGIVKRYGKDFGWYRIAYNGGSAYVNAKYLSAKKPRSSGSGSGSSSQEDPPDLDTQDPSAPVQPWDEEPPDRDTQDPNAAVQPWDEEPPDLDTQDPDAGKST